MYCGDYISEACIDCVCPYSSDDDPDIDYCFRCVNNKGCDECLLQDTSECHKGWC